MQAIKKKKLSYCLTLGPQNFQLNNRIELFLSFTHPELELELF